MADGGPIDHSYINDIYTLFYSLNNSMIPSGLFLNNTMISSGLFFGLTIIDELFMNKRPKSRCNLYKVR